MKKLMQPSGKHPALYYQESHLSSFDRIRIIYPNGTTELRDSLSHYYPNIIETPCWHVKGGTFEQQIKAMHEFDLAEGNPPAIFLGDIE
jgi:hypothetical protein